MKCPKILWLIYGRNFDGGFAKFDNYPKIYMPLPIMTYEAAIILSIASIIYKLPINHAGGILGYIFYFKYGKYYKIVVIWRCNQEDAAERCKKSVLERRVSSS